MKIQVEITSATECRSMNPFGKEPYKYSGMSMMSIGIATKEWNEWWKAESERKTYKLKFNADFKILKDIIFVYEKDSIKLFKIGSIHEAELNEQTNEVTIL